MTSTNDAPAWRQGVLAVPVRHLAETGLPSARERLHALLATSVVHYFPVLLLSSFFIFDLLILLGAPLAATILASLLAQLDLPLIGRHHTDTGFAVVFVVLALQTAGVPEGALRPRVRPTFSGTVVDILWVLVVLLVLLVDG